MHTNTCVYPHLKNPAGEKWRQIGLHPQATFVKTPVWLRRWMAPHPEVISEEACVAEVDGSSSWPVPEGAPKYFRSAPEFALKYSM